MTASGRQDRRKRELARDQAALVAAEPGYTFRETLSHSVWDETVLTERWEDRKARRAKEQGAHQ